MVAMSENSGAALSSSSRAYASRSAAACGTPSARSSIVARSLPASDAKVDSYAWSTRMNMYSSCTR